MKVIEFTKGHYTGKRLTVNDKTAWRYVNRNIAKIVDSVDAPAIDKMQRRDSGVRK